MDSGNNSASLQSSSTGGVGGGVSVGGDEEYDSRAASQSFSTAFHTQNSSSSSMFDPFINFFDPISRPQPPPPLPPPSQNHTTTQNSIYDLEFHWNSKRIRTDQTNNPLMLLPSSDFNNSLSFDATTGNISFPSRSEEHHAVGGNVSVTTITEQPADAAAADQPIAQQARNPKKRSRASRKAPTTVLTTDTTNFRAMVQEFTGIPGPPFNAPSYFPIRNRFDLFVSAANSAVRSVAPPPPPAVANNNPNFFISQPSSNYLPRPFPQNIQPPPPYLSPSSSSSPLVLNRLPINIASASSTTTSATNSAISNQLPSGVANSVAQGSNNFNSIQQNSIFTSLLQCSQKYPFGLKQQQQFQMPSNNISQFQMPSNNISQFQMPSSAQHGHLLTELPNLISEEQAATTSSMNDNTINATNFHGKKVQETVNATNFHGDNLQETVVATNFHGDKVQETVATKGVEGMVESWLLSTD
ncbi:hypothetical protein RDI58_011056 [Solanum bulbocastanum]|uniref:VQ domain-containing protein n=1 Tax=Solanum bulbocastanum TaxID=147425 RepID=A0AAN8TQE3_SOLBU